MMHGTHSMCFLSGQMPNLIQIMETRQGNFLKYGFVSNCIFSYSEMLDNASYLSLTNLIMISLIMRCLFQTYLIN